MFIATQEKLATCEPFVCNEDDLTDFFANDATKYHEKLLGKTYIFCLKENPQVIVAAFTLSNDSIRITNKLKDEDKETFLHKTELDSKGLRRYPSVLIGRLGVNKEFENLGYGSAVISFIKMWFLSENKTGCRFIIVDAYNNERTLHFYQKNDFEFLIEDEVNEAKYMDIGRNSLPLRTRLMFFDLLQVKTK
jgi:GNAT superfamily N-acetyltransferase